MPVKAKSSSVSARVEALARNLWWTWNPNAQALFASMDPKLFHATNQNPLRTLRMLSPERRELIESDPGFHKRLADCEAALRSYLSAPTWFKKTHGAKAGKLLVAYFCAEYAVHESIPQYSGGLGVLAGDHVKSASDLGLPYVGVGLLYRCGYYTQEFAADGSTRVIYPQLDFSELPVRDTGKRIKVPMAGKRVTARIWEQKVGRVSMYLMDTDVPANTPSDRALTRHLYGGDREYRIRQEMLLGVGGVLMLEALGLKPTVYHLNEGHAAFATLQRVAALVRKRVPRDKAAGMVSRSTVFTTHTPVPAGNDRFEPKLAMKYLAPIAREIGLSRTQMLALGRENEADPSEEFCMTVLALKLSEHRNGVAALHGDTSRRMWMKVFGATEPDAVPIGHVTNGVHSETWLAPEMRAIYDKFLHPNWNSPAPSNPWWKQADRIPDEVLWQTRRMLRQRMITFVRQRLCEQIQRRGGDAALLARAHETFDPDALTIGFARRFATYKRAPLVFRDAARLARILGDRSRPVQLVFAGKAHPKDLGGQAFAQEIHKHAHESQFAGRVVLLEDYDMQLGRMLTSGCDVWLNNPLRPQEASGTSGMKPPLHGGLNCSILDGWWPEAWDKTNGWAIGDGSQLADQARQDALDAQSIYNLLEREIVPAFYDRDAGGLPRRWIAMMKSSIRTVCDQFSTHRMVGDYIRDYYLPAHGGK
jgi:starch phosphorylase